jgi:hypothetical protein
MIPLDDTSTRLAETLWAEIKRVSRQRDRLADAIAAHRAVCMADDADDDTQHEADLALWHVAARMSDGRDGTNGER